MGGVEIATNSFVLLLDKYTHVTVLNIDKVEMG